MTSESQCPPLVLQFLKRRGEYNSPESRTLGYNYKPGSKDVIVCGAAKSGTTLVQHLCHGLRSGGDMSFEEIDGVVVCLELALDYGYTDLYQKQPFDPPMFKSHFPYKQTPTGAGKYVVIVRKPTDVVKSHYHFYENWLFNQGDFTLDEFVQYHWVKTTQTTSYLETVSSLDHLISWYPHRNDENVLWLHYEDIKIDMRKCIKLIAEFLDIGADDEDLQDLVFKQAGIDFMKKHISQFDLHLFKSHRNEALGLAKNAGLENNCGRVRAGEINTGKDVLMPSTLALINKVWTERVTSATGYKTYEEFRHGINKELNRKFG